MQGILGYKISHGISIFTGCFTFTTFGESASIFQRFNNNQDNTSGDNQLKKEEADIVLIMQTIQTVLYTSWGVGRDQVRR